MTDLVLPFCDPRAENVALSGGKGARLAKLAATGFNVPTGLIITTGAYRLFADSATEVLAAVADFDPSEVGDLAARSQALIADLSGLPLPEPVRTDIAAVLDTIEIGKSYAVREPVPKKSMEANPASTRSRSWRWRV